MIEFSQIRMKNILSFGNSMTSIDLSSHPMSLISGKNGSGKSSAILDTVTFALFGHPYRDINKPNLVNSINEKDCLVEIDFKIGKKKYMVRRGIKPAIFEIWIDGVMLQQDAKSKDYQKYLEQNILKMNYQSFSQIVVLGSSSYVPFMKLTAQQRRDVIEELLDIRIFSKMKIVLKEQASLQKERLKDIERSIQIAKEKMILQESHLQKLQSKNKDAVATIDAEILSTENTLSDLSRVLAQLDIEIADLKPKTDTSAAEAKAKMCAEVISLLKIQIDTLTKDKNFYTQNECCPTCKQSIDASFKDGVLKTKDLRMDEVLANLQKAQAQHQKCHDKIKASHVFVVRLNERESQRSEIVSNISSHSKYLAKIKSDRSKIVTDVHDITVETEKLKEYTEQHAALIRDKESLIDEKQKLEYAEDLLKDSGIKARVIQQYLPVMNTTINKYLKLMDCYFNFNLDENFKEVIKSRHRDTYQYNSFSEGEKFRIDMALLLTWREISRNKNSTNTNLLILDEVFDKSLDLTGTDEFMKLLRLLSGKINIFVISHKPDVLSDKFDRHMKVEKVGGFSIIK